MAEKRKKRKKRKGGRTFSDSYKKPLSEMSSTELGTLLHRLDKGRMYPLSEYSYKQRLEDMDTLNREEIEKEYFRRDAAEKRVINRPGVNPEEARLAWYKAEEKLQGRHVPIPSLTESKRRDMLHLSNQNRGGSVKGRPAKRSAENS